jgi:spermidine synthase
LSEPSSGSLDRAWSRRHLAVVLVLVVAGNAAGAMIVEITAGRLLAPYFGMSLETWTTVIGVVLTGLALGHWAGGRLADARPERRAEALGLACLAGAVSTILVLPILNIVAGSLSAADVAVPTAIVATGFAAFLIPSLTAGLIQPIATTFALEVLGSRAGSVIGRMLAAGVMGAILGTFLAGFVLVAYLGSAGSIWLVAALNAGLAALFVPAFRQQVVAWALVAIAAFFMLSGWSLPGFATPCAYESRYYCIGVFSGEARNLPGARLLRLDALTQSVNLEAPAYLAFSHLQWMDELVRQRFAAEPFSAFFIGGGGYTLPRTWLARDPATAITVAELDPLVTTIAQERLWFEPGPATEILDMDARLALARMADDRRFDVIVGDAFRDVALPAHLITDEFHALVSLRLTADGFYVINIIDAVQPRRLVASAVETLRHRFPVVEVWYDAAAYQTSDSINFIVYASARPSGLQSPLEASSAPATTWARLTAPTVANNPGPVFLTDDFAPVERLLGR